MFISDLCTFLISSKLQEGSRILSFIILILEVRELKSKKEAQYGEILTCVILLLRSPLMFQLVLLCNKPLKNSVI